MCLTLAPPISSGTHLALSLAGLLFWALAAGGLAGAIFDGLLMRMRHGTTGSPKPSGTCSSGPAPSPSILGASCDPETFDRLASPLLTQRTGLRGAPERHPSARRPGLSYPSRGTD